MKQPIKVKKIVGKIHLWLGLASGLVVFILGITGCIYVFIDEIKPLVYQDRMFVKPQPTAQLSLTQLLEKAREAVQPDQSIIFVLVFNDPERTVQFYAHENHDKPQGIWFWDEIKYSFVAYLDPYTGALSKLENRTFEFFTLILWLHFSLLLHIGIGQPIVGIACIIFVISLITGLVLWWPKNKAAARQRFWFRWKSTTRWKRKNYDLHNIAGFYMMIFALVIALTGLVWAFDWFEDGVKWLANGGKTIAVKKVAVVSDTTRITAQYPIDKVLQNLRQEYPQAKRYSLSIPKKPSETYYATIDYEILAKRITAQYDQHSGKQLEKTTFTDKNNGEKLRALNYDIHVGAIGGLAGKILAFFASLVSASLPITGFLIWWGRRKKQHSRGAKKVAAGEQGKGSIRIHKANTIKKIQ